MPWGYAGVGLGKEGSQLSKYMQRYTWDCVTDGERLC